MHASSYSRVNMGAVLSVGAILVCAVWLACASLLRSLFALPSATRCLSARLPCKFPARYACVFSSGSDAEDQASVSSRDVLMTFSI